MLRKLNVNWLNLIKTRGVSLVLATVMTTSFAGCAKTVDCDINGRHAHLYTNTEGYNRYIESEKEKYEGFIRSDEYVELTKEDEEFLKFLDKKDLLRISENIDTILNKQEENKDYIEYRYRYIYMQPIPHYVNNGKTTSVYFTYIPVTHYSWTRDKNHSNLTGEERLCHYVYTAYKIVKDENKKYVIVSSEEVDDVREVMNEYPFIKKNFYKVIDAEYGTNLDYEDGPSDLSDEEQEELDNEYQEEKTYTKKN